MNTKRITRSDVENNLFYQMPKFLFQGIFKEKLTNDARVLYSLLRDRHQLSLKNNWVNERGEVFILFSRENMKDMLGISKNPTKNAIDLLKKYNLVQEERQGQGKPNMIYLMVTNVENTKNDRNRRSSESKTDVKESPDVTASNTEYNKTEINNNNKDVVVSEITVEKIKEKTKNHLFKEQIEEIIKQTGATEEELLTMVEVMSNSTSTINNPIGWLIKAIKNGYKVAKSLNFNNNQSNAFHNFQTNNKEYTNDELEKLLGMKS